MSLKKEQNKRGIVKELYFSRMLSCADLCDKQSKSLPLITKLVAELLEENKIIESGLAPSTGGRRAVTYTVRADVSYILAVSMDQLITSIGLMDMHKQFIGEIVKVDLLLKNNADALDILTQALVQFLQGSPVPKEKIIGVGIAMPGFVDVKRGINYSFLKSNRSISQSISRVLDLPVFIDNDSSLIALAELRFGAAVSEKNALVINMGWGVGLGMVLDGELYRGENGFAGEFSHIPLFNNKKLCSCGKQGCLETETSLLVLVENAKKGIEAGRISSLQQVPFDAPEKANQMIIQAALDGDQFAVELLSDIGLVVGRGVSILIHLLNPKLIVLSGRGAMAGRIWQAPIQQALNEYCIPRLAQHSVIKVSELGYHAEMIGAAALVMENYDRMKAFKVDIPNWEEVS